MSSRSESRAHVPRITAELREGEVVKPLELFFDLVCVLAFTQCTAFAYETANYDERRYRLRHGLDPDPPSPLGGERA